MVCHRIFQKAFGERKPQDADGVNSYCRQQSCRLVFRHLEQLYDDLNGNVFRQPLDFGNQLLSTPVGNQLPLVQPGYQLPLAQPGNQLPFTQPRSELPFVPSIEQLSFARDEPPIDESSRRRSLSPGSYSRDYYTAGADQTYSHIHGWLQESGLPTNSQSQERNTQRLQESILPMNSQSQQAYTQWLQDILPMNSQSIQPNTPHVTVIRPSSPGEDRLNAPQERRGRASSLPQGNVTGTSLNKGKAKEKYFNSPLSLSNKRLPDLPTGSRTNITVQDVTDISHSIIPVVNLPDRLRTQEAGPSSPLKNVLKPPQRSSTVSSASTSAEGSRSGFEKDLNLLSHMIVAQIEFCHELLAGVLSTEPALQQNLKDLADLLRRKSPEELEEFGLLELGKLHSRSTRLSDRIKKRYNMESVQKLCEEVNPTVEVWIDKLQVNQVGRLLVSPYSEGIDERYQVTDTSEISDTSEGVAGLQARRMNMTAIQIGKLKERHVENSAKLALQASGTGNELPHVTPRFIYLKKISFP